MERPVLHDCNSEQVRALIEEHNKMVEFLRQLAPDKADKLPAIITLKRRN